MTPLAASAHVAAPPATRRSRDGRTLAASRLGTSFLRRSVHGHRTGNDLMPILDISSRSSRSTWRYVIFLADDIEKGGQVEDFRLPFLRKCFDVRPGRDNDNLVLLHLRQLL